MIYDSSDRGIASMARAAAMAVALCCSALAPAVAADQPPTPAPAMTPSPAAAPKGEFDHSCAMGLASGQVVKTDCSVNWTAPDGKVYCFSTEASKATFLKSPDENIQKAKEFFLAQGNTCSLRFRPVRKAPRSPTKSFTEEDVDKRVAEVIAERSKDGAFVFHDPKLDADLNLVFEQIKIVRGMEGYGWFANAIFHDKDAPKKQYAIDFWLKPEGDKLTLMDIRVQKGPKQDGDSYYMVTRMPVAWWWLPVQEHPGDMEVTRAWQVMGAIHDLHRHPQRCERQPADQGRQDRRNAAAAIRRNPPAGASSEEGRRIFRLHRFPQAGQHGRVLRHRFLGEPEDRQARSRQRQGAQGPGAGGRRLDASAPLYLRGHGFRRDQLIAAYDTSPGALSRTLTGLRSGNGIVRRTRLQS